MNPVGIAVITKLPYELIEIQALFNVVENVCIGYFAVNVSIKIQGAALNMLRGIATVKGRIEFWRPVS